MKKIIILLLVLLLMFILTACENITAITGIGKLFEHSTNCYICGKYHDPDSNGGSSRIPFFDIYASESSDYLRVYVECCWNTTIPPEYWDGFIAGTDIKGLYEAISNARSNIPFEVILIDETIKITTETPGLEEIYITYSQNQPEVGFAYSIIRNAESGFISDDLPGNNDIEDQTAVWSVAYRDAINDLIVLYGKGNIVPHSFDNGESIGGVGIVRLIDFDGDGIPELYIAYSDGDTFWLNWQVVFGYDDGLITLLEPFRVSNPGTDVSPSVTFVTKNNIVYIWDVYEIANGCFYSLQDGKMIAVSTYYNDFWDEENYMLNGEPVTKEDMFAAIDNFLEGAVVERISFTYDIDLTELEKTQETISQIKYLASKIE